MTAHLRVTVGTLGEAAEIRNVARKADAERLAAGRVWVPIRDYTRPEDTCWIGRLLSDKAETLAGSAS